MQNNKIYKCLIFVFFMTNIHDGLSLYKSGEEYFVSVSDEDAVLSELGITT